MMPGSYGRSNSENFSARSTLSSIASSSPPAEPVQHRAPGEPPLAVDDPPRQLARLPQPADRLLGRAQQFGGLGQREDLGLARGAERVLPHHERVVGDE